MGDWGFFGSVSFALLPKTLDQTPVLLFKIFVHFTQDRFEENKNLYELRLCLSSYKARQI